MNNISFQVPSIDIREAYYYHVNGVFGTRFLRVPPLFYNFTGTNLPLFLQTPEKTTKVKIIEYN